jgi:23S rRNA-/tRNA-specific pseudouridylate synthase
LFLDPFIRSHLEHGIAVHPGEGEENDHTLVSALLFHFGAANLSDGEDAGRPGIVHRLDKGTQEVVVGSRVHFILFYFCCASIIS